jgi:hypothetical protein
MSYVISEYDSTILKSTKAQSFYVQKCAQLETLMRQETEAVWSGLVYGGFTPGPREYGRTTILPDNFADENADILDTAHSPNYWGRNSYQQYFTSASPAAYAIPGWKTILQGPTGAALPTGGRTLEDIRIAWIGLAITSKSSAITKFIWNIGDTTYPKLDVEETQGYNKPSLVFEEGFIIPEETLFYLRGYFECDSYERVVPLGYMVYRRKDLVITES